MAKAYIRKDSPFFWLSFSVDKKRYRKKTNIAGNQKSLPVIQEMIKDTTKDIFKGLTVKGVIEAGDLNLTEEWIKTNSQYFKTYVFYDELNERYKIGRSVNPERRLRELEGSNGVISIVLVINEDYENFLHRMFAHKRKYGEWFSLDDNDIQIIKNLYKGEI